MADEKAPAQKPHDDDAVGKAYDSRLMGRLLRYLKPYWLAVVVSLIAIAVKSVCDVLGPFITKVAVDRYLDPTHRNAQLPFLNRWLSNDAITGISQLAGLYIATLLVSYGLEFVQTYLMQWTGQKVMFDLRTQIFSHLQRMHPAFFDRNPVGRLVTRVTSDVDALNEMFTSGVVSIFEDVFVLLGIIFVMLRMSWWLALIALSVLPLILIATRIFRHYVRESYRRIRAAIARINSYTQEHVSGMSVVQLFNREKRSYQAFEDVNRQHMDAFKDQILAYSLYYPVVELFSSLAIALIIWLGGGGVLRNTVTLGVLVAFLQYSQRFFRPIQDLSEKYNILQAAMAASERIFKLLDTSPELLTPEVAKAGDGSGRIEFRNVWFTYQRLDEETLARLRNSEIPPDDGSIEWILRGVSFTIQPDETAALVGHTGAGKTTITSLMMRFYDIQHGQILVDGVDVREQDLSELRRRFAVVLQDPFLFSGTIASNIRLGTDWITNTDLERVAEEVNLSEFINTLPSGLEEPV
ncbi:MAG TPA: ABC transporter transmembrane domain-containing protein, partial [Acidobacteriaceae bacterium]|nr:ABC transporter transmembrane domain-containing protein [Acidobacteriaceae bacterium]